MSIKVMVSNIPCEYNGCRRNVKDPQRTTCGYHKRHTRTVIYNHTHTKTLFINNIIPDHELNCFQFENEVDLGNQELRTHHIQHHSLVLWKLPCNNRTKLANTNKNRDHQLSPGERRLTRTCHQKNATIVTYSSEIGQLLSYHLPNHFHMTVRTTENVLTGIHSTDPRVEYVTFYSRKKDIVLSMASHLMSLSREQPRQFHDYYIPPHQTITHKPFTELQKQNQELFLDREGREKNLYIYGGFGKEFAKSQTRRSCHALKYRLYHVYNASTQHWHKMNVDEFVQIRDLPLAFAQYGINTLYSMVHPKFMSIFV